MIEDKNAEWGAEAGEDCHFYFSNAELPFSFIGTGITYPNPNYIIRRPVMDFFSVEYVVSGKGYLETADKKFTLQAGDIYIVAPGDGHRYYADSEDPFEKKWLTFSSPSFESAFKTLKLNGQYVFHNCYDLEKLFDEIILIGRSSNCSDHVQFKLGMIALEIIYRLAQGDRHETYNNVSKVAFDTKAILDSSIFTNIKISDVAAKLNYSTKQISREFEKYFGETPYKYYLNNKIEVAKKILVSTNISIKEITNQLCFDNQHSFCNTFKMKVGMSPTEYRRTR